MTQEAINITVVFVMLDLWDQNLVLRNDDPRAKMTTMITHNHFILSFSLSKIIVMTRDHFSIHMCKFKRTTNMKIKLIMSVFFLVSFSIYL